MAGITRKEWLLAADRILWFAVIDRRPDKSARWGESAAALLEDKPVDLAPCYETIELSALAGLPATTESACPVCLEEAISERWTVGSCCHALCAACSVVISRCPICRRQAAAKQRFRFLEATNKSGKHLTK
nr:RING-finger domain-containing protein [Oceanusvirus sp.]